MAAQIQRCKAFRVKTTFAQFDKPQEDNLAYRMR
jgi:hypothetical protein